MSGTVLSAKHGTRMAHSSSQNSQPTERDPVSMMTQKYTLEGIDLGTLPQSDSGFRKGFLEEETFETWRVKGRCPGKGRDGDGRKA